MDAFYCQLIHLRNMAGFSKKLELRTRQTIFNFVLSNTLVLAIALLA